MLAGCATQSYRGDTSYEVARFGLDSLAFVVFWCASSRIQRTQDTGLWFLDTSYSKS